LWIMPPNGGGHWPCTNWFVPSNGGYKTESRESVVISQLHLDHIIQKCYYLRVYVNLGRLIIHTLAMSPRNTFVIRVVLLSITTKGIVCSPK
jgi:hypothetical protein